MPSSGQPPGPSPRRFSRRRLFLGLGGAAVGAVAGGAYACSVEPFWIEYPELAMPLRGLAESFRGFRIAHLSDLHASDIVPLEYLARVIEAVNARRPDLVVITGDLLTGLNRWIDPLGELLRSVRAPIIATLGNHDHGFALAHGRGPLYSLADRLVARLKAGGHTVLINEHTTIQRGGARLWIVGLDDLWKGFFSPEAAFRGVPPDEPIVALSHNPDTFVELQRTPAQWVLAGHTHGGQVRLPLLGAPVLPVDHREWAAGLFEVNGRRLYVSRGVGYIRKVRLFCRPEAPLFTLRPA